MSNGAVLCMRSFYLLAWLNLWLCLGGWACSEAHAETVWIEAKTGLYVTPNGLDGGRVNVTLVDDLNHPVAGAIIRLELTHRTTQTSVERIAETDDLGNADILTDLTEGQWDGNVQFEGNDGYLPSNHAFLLDVERCKNDFSLHLDMPLGTSNRPKIHQKRDIFDIFRQKEDESQTLSWPVGEPLKLKVIRSSSECSKLRTEVKISLNDVTHVVQFEPRELMQSVELNTKDITSGIAELKAVVQENRAQVSESIIKSIYFYDAIFKPEIEAGVDWRGSYIKASVMDEMRHVYMPVRLKFSDGLIGEQLETVADEEGQLEFIYSRRLSGCFKGELSRADSWSDRGKLSFDVCFPESSSFDIRWFGVLGAAGFIGMTSAYVLLKRRRRRLPPAPGKASSSQICRVEDWPEGVHPKRRELKNDEHTTEVVCVDNKTGMWIASASCLEIQENTWPIRVESGTYIHIIHKDYMDWHGRIRGTGRYVIRMTSRRDYAIACFDAVSSQFYGRHVDWGEISPQAMMIDVKKQNMKQTQQKNYERFCELSSQAAFDTGHFTDASVTEIYALSQKCRYRAKETT